MTRPLQDEERALPVPTAWRDTLAAIVSAFASGTPEALCLPPVFVGAAVARQVREAVADYGETLAELPAAAWQSSLCQWMGDSWDVLVDLWTTESGPSDLVLFVRVTESGSSYRFEVQGVWVP